MAVIDFDQAAALTAFFSSVIFLIGYSIVAPWWHHPIGRAVASLDCGLILALTPAALHQLFGLSLNHAWFAWYYGWVLILVSAITLYRLVVIVNVQRSATPRYIAPEPQDRVPEEVDG